MYYSLKVGGVVAKFIPRKVGLKISYFIGNLYGSMPTKSRANIIKVQSIVSPGAKPAQLKKLAGQVVGNYSQYWWDVFWMSTPRSVQQLEKIVRVEGESFFDEVKQFSENNGIGMIVVIPHVGSWEIPGAYLAHIGYPPVVVAERLTPPELFELFSRTRTQAGMTVIAHDDSPSAKLVHALEQQKMVCLVADRDLSRKGVVVNFFGKIKTMPPGPASLAIKTGAPIIPACMYTTHSGEIEVSFSEPIYVSEHHGATKNEKIQMITQKLADEFELMISKTPTQWHVLKSEWQENG